MSFIYVYNSEKISAFEGESMNSQQKKGISAAVMKNTAVVLMFINHFSVGWYRCVTPVDGFYNFQWYLTRMVFVIYAFLISEGMIYTRSREKYMLRLLAVGLLSEALYDKFVGGTVPYWPAQNIFFTLFLGTLAIFLIDRLKSLPFLSVTAAAAILAASWFTNVDYGFMGVGLILIFYYLRERKPLMFAAASVCIFTGWFLQNTLYILPQSDPALCLKSALLEMHGALAFPLLALYNGRRGRQLPKLFYYLFYPCHLALILLIVFVVNSI